MCLFIVQNKIKKRKENKINIKSEKLNKRKEKLSVSKVFYNKNRESKDYKMYKRVWKTVEAKVGKTRVTKTER